MTAPVTEDAIRQKLKADLGAVHIDLTDESGGCGQMFSCTVVSAAFDKKTSLARNRLVNAALKEEIAAMHAWSAKCLTPEQWIAAGGVLAAGSPADGDDKE